MKIRIEQIVLVLIFLLSISCKREVVTKENTIKVISNADSIIVVDTVVGRPYQWGSIINGQIKKIIDINGFCSYCENDIIDVYWGSSGTNWLRLPFIDNTNRVSVNYQWERSTLFVFAYGDSTTLADKSYWDKLRFNTLRVKVTTKKN